MPDLHELAEHIEHAGHGSGHPHAAHAGGQPATSKAIGISMAVLGVMLAFCAAMVGAARTEFVATMVEQSNRFSLYQSESMKFRVMEADVEMLHALTPTPAEVGQLDGALATIRRVSGKADDEDTQELKAAIAIAAKEVAEVLSADPEDEAHLKGIARHYEHDMREAKEDAECYDDKIKAHFESAEWYERAQLCAEIGIVVASVALLLASRRVWLVALLFGACSALLIVRTYVHTSGLLQAANEKIVLAQQRTTEIEGADETAPPGGVVSPAAPAASAPSAPGSR